ncbi:hypothetical protein CBER1_10398 [Cercospora berteroae]|uniref:RGS domain-containing protein n=1 Tax=Cercospora berteroae TaxID=357750 RepID=A0A2S6BX58_9PEZI|nr:hypothetical protein CBER1_10398 [Cercospora berteroae]
MTQPWPTARAVVSENNMQSNGFNFDFPNPLTVVKPRSTDEQRESGWYGRELYSKARANPEGHQHPSQGPFELQANDKVTEEQRNRTSPTDSAIRVDSARASTTPSGDSSEPSSARSQNPTNGSFVSLPPLPDGSSQAYSAYSALRRTLDPGRSQSLMHDILSRETFLDALDNPPAKHRLREFTKVLIGSKHISFLDQVQQHRKVLEESYSAIASIDERYLNVTPPARVDLPPQMNNELRANVGTVLRETQPTMKNMFNEAENTVQDTIYTQSYPHFVRLQMTLGASEALSGDRHRFHGLGDCFCLTKPSQADNPIVYASDGFVAVTGYQRKDIIPRNCRFLQGEDTDSSSVDRIRHCIRTQQESVEFLLNYRKNGEPFWNLLYTAPLLDSRGQVAFYIGGQVNCSSTIQDKAGIMKILAISPDHQSEKEREQTSERAKNETPASELARRVEHLKSLRYREKAEVAPEPGLERSLVARNQDIALTERIENFYNAYSKYLVIGYPSMTIQFSSAGISSVLLPSNSNAMTADRAPRPNQHTSRHVFNFLKDNMKKRERTDWTSKVRSSLKKGNPISVALHLQTKRSVVYRGDEKFMTHWTPMKDVQGKTEWVVLSLALVGGQA